MERAWIALRGGSREAGKPSDFMGLRGLMNTPHMFVIDPSGKIAYAGALDNAPMGEPR